jgi:hypothetical protein
VAGARTKSKLKEIRKARGGPSDKNSDEVNNKSVEEVNMAHSPVHMLFRVSRATLSMLHLCCWHQVSLYVNNCQIY